MPLQNKYNLARHNWDQPRGACLGMACQYDHAALIFFRQCHHTAIVFLRPRRRTQSSWRKLQLRSLLSKDKRQTAWRGSPLRSPCCILLRSLALHPIV